ncbi:MAG: hypothetical protein NTU98_14615 [Bacteroidetes bacterium]|nr:hypothetical protein [Bacteroidota bacterium]
MKKHILIPVMAIGFLSVIISGCTKSSTTTPETTPTSSVPTVSYNFSDANGVLVSLMTVTSQTVGGVAVPYQMNTPTAAFPTTLGATTFLDGGSVTFNTKALVKQSNNAYLYTDLANPVTYDQSIWSVSGSANVPSFNYTDTRTFPEFTNFNNLPGAFSKMAGLAVVLGGFTNNADSVYVVLISSGNGKSVMKRLPGNAVPCIFSQSDVADLATGAGYLEVCPWTYSIQTFNSKSFYFIKEAAYVKAITINN